MLRVMGDKVTAHVIPSGGTTRAKNIWAANQITTRDAHLKSIWSPSGIIEKRGRLWSSRVLQMNTFQALMKQTFLNGTGTNRTKSVSLHALAERRAFSRHATIIS